MVDIHQIGANGVWTGASREIGEGKGAPAGWTRSPLPALGEGEVARFVNGKWRAALPPPEAQPDLGGLRNAAKARFAEWADGVLAQQAGIVPDAERLSWSIKAEAARAYLAEADEAEPDYESLPAHFLAILQSEADETGETLLVLSQQIVARESGYLGIAGKLAAWRRTIGADIDAAGTPEAIETALTDGLSNAQATLEAMQS